MTGERSVQDVRATIGSRRAQDLAGRGEADLKRRGRRPELITWMVRSMHDPLLPADTDVDARAIGVGDGFDHSPQGE